MKQIIKYSWNKKHKQAFTIIEALVFLFIFVISVLAIYQAFNVGLTYIIDSKKRVAAVDLANEMLEKYRNLGYDTLATLTPVETNTQKNGITFHTVVNFTEMDDDEDGICDSEPGGTDSACADYNKVSVEVSWPLGGATRRVKMSTNVVPPVIEEELNTGCLRLHILGQNGTLPYARIKIEKSATHELEYTGNVDANGDFFRAGIDPGSYKIIIYDDNNYFPLETLNTGGGFVPVAELEHVGISADDSTEKTIHTDKMSTLDIVLTDTFGNVVSHLGFEIYGGKKLGTKSGVDDFSFPVDPDTDPKTVTDSDGENFSGLCYGSYYLNFNDLNDGSHDYQFLWMRKVGQTQPITDVASRVDLDADETLNTEAYLARKDIPSILVTVKDSADKQPLVGAEVHLVFTGSPAYDETLTTNQLGQVYFPSVIDTMINDDYSYTIKADGYDDATDTFTIDDFTEATVELTAS